MYDSCNPTHRSHRQLFSLSHTTSTSILLDLRPTVYVKHCETTANRAPSYSICNFRGELLVRLRDTRFFRKHTRFGAPLSPASFGGSKVRTRLRME